MQINSYFFAKKHTYILARLRISFFFRTFAADFAQVCTYALYAYAKMYNQNNCFMIYSEYRNPI